MAVALHCDRDGCDTWQSKVAKNDPSWVRVYWGGKKLHFCCGWCCAVEMSTLTEPTETIEMGL